MAVGLNWIRLMAKLLIPSSKIDTALYDVDFNVQLVDYEREESKRKVMLVDCRVRIVSIYYLRPPKFVSFFHFRLSPKICLISL